MLLRKLELWQTAVSYSRKFNLGVGNREKADTGSTAAAADSGYSRKLVTERRRILVVPVPPRRQTAVTAVNITWELVTESRRTLVVPLLRQTTDTAVNFTWELVTERRRTLVVPLLRQTAFTAVNFTWELVTESRRTLVVPPALLRQAAETGTAAPPVM
jgi:hypothetical protein